MNGEVCFAAGVSVVTPQVAWHGLGEEKALQNLPVLSCDRRGALLATAGGDNCARLWQASESGTGFVFVASLAGHEKSVNCVRFSPDGSRVATGGDDGMLVVWTLDAEKTAALETAEGGERQVWRAEWRVSLATDVYDVSWNAAGNELAAASTDHKATIFAVRADSGLVKLAELAVHRKYVQGVAFDPRCEYLATASNDKSVRLFSLYSKNRARKRVPTCEHEIRKILSQQQQEESTGNVAASAAASKSGLFHDDTVPTFFRRIAFSPEGSLLVCPTGRAVGLSEEQTNVTHVLTRGSLPYPVLQLPCGLYPSVVARFSPVIYSLRPESPSVFDLSYRMIFAVGTTDSQVIVYDTQQRHPICRVAGIHYEPINDLAWSDDGTSIFVASTDGFCSIVRLDADTLGVPLSAERRAEVMKVNEPPPPSETKKKKEVEAETPVAGTTSPKRDRNSFFAGVVPKTPEQFVEAVSVAEVEMSGLEKPTVFKKSKN